MQDHALKWRLHRGDPIHVDCAASKVVNSVVYQQPAESRLHASRQQKSSLDIGGQFPDKSSCVHGTAHFDCDANSGDRATISARLCAQREHGFCALSTGEPGAINAEAELRGRKYILLLRQFLHTKVQLGCSQSNTTKLTSGAEVTVPIFPNCLKFKAGTTTDFAHQLTLLTELSWRKPLSRDAATRKHTPKSKTALKPVHRLSDDACTLPQADDSTAVDCISAEASAKPLPWAFPTKKAWSLYVKKNRVPATGAFSRSGHDNKSHASATEKPDQDGSKAAMGPGDQVSLQLKGACKGKPAPYWQLRVQKALSSRTQLRAQVKTDSEAVGPFQSKWQLEARRKLAKGASANIRLVQDQQNSAQYSNSLRHSLRLEHKSRTNLVTCACHRQVTGWQLTVKAKARSFRSKDQSQNWHVFFSGQANFGTSPGNKSALKAEISVPC